MERLLRCFVVVSLLLVGAGMVRAQITIESNDVQQAYLVGRTVVYHYDTQTTSIDLGSSISPMTWDFSGFGSNTSHVLRSVELGASPYAGEFPQATHAILDTAFLWRLNADAFMAGLGWGTIKSSAAYYYYSFGTELTYHGLGAVATGYLDLQPATAIPIDNPRWRNTPPSVEYSFPLVMSKTWTSNYIDSLTGKLTLPIFGTFPIALGNTDAVTYTVDAYGTLIVPGGHTQEALRIRKAGKYSYVDTVNGFNIPLQYIFLAKNGAMVEAGLVDSTVTGGVAQVRYVKWTVPLPTDVEEVADVPASFGLHQNYPNPFNPATTIWYSVGELGSRQQAIGNRVVKLAVYDLLGREVAVLVDEQKQPGEYMVTWDARGMASGMYICRMQAGTFTQTRTMSLVR